MLFAFLFLLQDHHCLLPDDAKKMKKFFSPPKPVRVERSRPMTGLDLAALLAKMPEEGKAGGVRASSGNEGNESAARPLKKPKGGENYGT